VSPLLETAKIANTVLICERYLHFPAEVPIFAKSKDMLHLSKVRSKTSSKACIAGGGDSFADDVMEFALERI